MKKLIFTIALLINTVFVFASNGTSVIAHAHTDNVKMYRQAGTSTDVVKALKSTDEVTVVRKHNANWTIVMVNGEVGYVLTTELAIQKEVKNIAAGKQRQANIL